MTAVYPRVIKDFTAKPGPIPSVMAVDVNGIQDEIIALESVIGVSPLASVHKQRTLTNPLQTLADRLDSFGELLAKPIFSSWIGGLDDLAVDTSESTTHTSTQSVTSWGAYEPYGIADSPDNYPGGMYGVHPATKPAVEAGAVGIGKYGFEWNNQSEWVQFASASAIAAGGQADSKGIRYPTTTSSTSSYVTTLVTRASSPTDANGIFTLPKPAVGSDPLDWYNGSNGFVIKKTGWYHLTGTAAWKTEGEWGTTRRLTIFGSDRPLAMRDVQGNVGISTEHKSIDFIGILLEGTVLTLGIRSFNLSNPSLGYRAMSPRLSGVFLRGV